MFSCTTSPGLDVYLEMHVQITGMGLTASLPSIEQKPLGFSAVFRRGFVPKASVRVTDEVLRDDARVAQTA
jgi:hypothetical protein